MIDVERRTMAHVERRKIVPCGWDTLISLDLGSFESGVGGVDRVEVGLRLWVVWSKRDRAFHSGRAWAWHPPGVESSQP